MWPRRVWSALERSVGVSPAQPHRWSASGKRESRRLRPGISTRSVVEAATHALGNCHVGPFFIGIERRGTKIVRVARARRLVTLVYHALRDEGGCRAFPVPHKSRSPRGQARSFQVMAS